MRPVRWSKPLFVLASLIAGCGEPAASAPGDDTAASDTSAADGATADLGASDVPAAADGAADAPLPDVPLPDVPQSCPCDGSFCPCLDDGDPCTADSCVPGACSHKPICAALLPAGVGASPCRLEGDLPEPQGLELVPVFAGAKITQPIFLGPWGDGSDRLFVVQRSGKVVLIPNDPQTKLPPLVVVDVAKKLNTAGEGGLLSAAMHPKFKQNRKMYVSLTTGAPMHSQIIEYTVGSDDVAVLASERLVIDVQQPAYTNHKGGMIAFDKKGMLLFGLGDGGYAGDPDANGQNKQTLLAKMVRIDVDGAGNGLGYSIPKDNPFVGNPAYLPEIFTVGMRNPWRFSVDRLTGEIWAGDVGQDVWEEVDKIEAGKNYGWKTMEATHCFPPSVTACAKAGLTPPVVEYPHTVGKSITGGYVYRGSKQKSLYGKYLFADFDQGKLFTLPPTGLAPVQLGKATFQPVSFGEDRDGELYVMQLYGPLGTIFKLQEATPKPPAKPLPLTLSGTQCFSDLKTLQPAAGLIPYAVNVPLWSDGANKQRFLVLPPGAQPGTTPIAVGGDDYTSWTLPLGTLLIKHFALGDNNTPVETRFMRRDADGWKFFTFQWRADGLDADLLPGGGGEATFATTAAGAASSATWHYPAMTDCASCHHAAGSFDAQVLGVQTAQLDRPALWGSVQVPNQLGVLRGSGLIGPTVKAATPFPDLPQLTAVASDKGVAARAWLHVNCSHCHRPGGAAPSDMDLRYQTPLSANHACGAAAQNGTVGGATQLLVPGNPPASVLWQRIQQSPGGGLFMPDAGVTVAQPGLVALLSAWIGGLQGCLP